MEFKGTKGEWAVGFSRKIGEMKVSFIEVGQKEGFKTICKTFDVNTHRNKLEYQDYETGLANAKLIAQAPKLLSALEDAVIGMEWRVENQPEIIDKSDLEKLEEWKLLIQNILT